MCNESVYGKHAVLQRGFGKPITQHLPSMESCCLLLLSMKIKIEDYGKHGTVRMKGAKRGNLASDSAAREHSTGGWYYATTTTPLTTK